MPTSRGSSESDVKRRDGQTGTPAVDLGDDDGDSGGPPPEERALLGPAFLHGAEPS